MPLPLQVVNYNYSIDLYERKVDIEQPFETEEATGIDIIEEYCSNSTLHGVRYFVEKKRHWIERVWWILGFTVSMCCCGILINKMYGNWDRRSIIVNFAGDLTPVWDIPFPAITICPSTKIELTHFDINEMFERMQHLNFTDEEYKIMSTFNYICGPYTSFSRLPENFTDRSYTDVIKQIAPNLNSTVKFCSFPTRQFKCQLEEIITEEGLCYTFNMLNGEETYSNDSDYTQIRHNKSANWNLDNGYDHNIRKQSQTYPQRVFSSGADGLHLFLALTTQYLLNSCSSIPGFTIALHTPGEIPQVSKHYFRLAPLETASVSVKPNIITTSDGLKTYHPDRRQCFFDSERKLRFLRVYTQRNCELECLSNFTLSLCGCVRFFMPSDANTPICGHAKLDCSQWARNNLLKGQIRQGKIRQGLFYKQVDDQDDIILKQLVERCNCLPACNSIIYDAEILKTYNNQPINGKIGYISSNVNVFFKENEFMTLTRSELYGLTDFVANCGGLLGLFIGASFLSVVELLYYCSLRLCCNIRKRINRKVKNQIAISTISRIIIVKAAEESNSNY